jgi:hypothetical protein
MLPKPSVWTPSPYAPGPLLVVTNITVLPLPRIPA